MHTKKTEYAVETDEEEELDEPLAEEESEDEFVDGRRKRESVF